MATREKGIFLSVWQTRQLSSSSAALHLYSNTYVKAGSGDINDQSPHPKSRVGTLLSAERLENFLTV